MDAKLGRKVCPAVEKVVKGSIDPSVTWTCLETDGIESIADALQVFIDK